MTEQEVVLMERLLTTIDSGSARIVEAYSSWFVYASLSYIAFGMLLSYVSYLGVRKFHKISKENKFDDKGMGEFIFSCFALLVGLLFIFANISDLFAPDAAAIHQIIKDIR